MNEFMVLVERAVRPVCAGPRTKLRMREELLAHLTGIYEAELARLGDEAAARAEAVRRFGDPAALTTELKESVSVGDRIDGWLNMSLGWRAPESSARHTLRLAALLLVYLLPLVLVSLIVTAKGRAADPTVPDSATLLRGWGAVQLIGTVNVFLLGVLYFRIRDSLHGALGSRRSLLRVAGFAALFGVVILASVFGLYLAVFLDVGEAVTLLSTWETLAVSCVAAIVLPAIAIAYARKLGPDEIRHTQWVTLEIG
jgi:hypothetical protein